MNIKYIEKMINELLNNIVVQFIHETHNYIFINNKKLFLIFLHIFSLPLHNIY